MIRRVVQEWQALPFGDGEREISETLAGRLHDAVRHSPLAKRREEVLRFERTRLRAGQIVGVIAVDDGVLEILPKIDGLDEGGLRRQLIHMLGVAHDLKLDASAAAALDVQNQTLLEILIGRFARQLIDAARQGLPHEYVSRRDDLPALRGKLRTVRQFTTLAVAPDRLACEFDDYSADIPLNQIMKAAASHALGFARSATNRRLLQEVLARYGAISKVAPSALPWRSVRLDRTNSRWQALHDFARLLLEGSYQTTTMGGAKGVALLFEMNILFEVYMAKMIGRALKGSDYTVVAQGGLKYCLRDADTRREAFQTKPDILLRKGKEVVLVIDTKWKRLRSDSAKRDASQADVYQMMAYGQVYGCGDVMLLYPHSEEVGCEEGVIGEFEVIGGGGRLVMATIDLSGGSGPGLYSRIVELAKPASE